MGGGKLFRDTGKVDAREQREAGVATTGLRVYPYPCVYPLPDPYPSGTRRVGVSLVGSGTGRVITGTVYPVLSVPKFSFGVTLSPLHVAVNLTTG